MNLDEKHIRWILLGIGVGAFVMLLALEVVTEDETVSFLDLGVDAIQLLLTISASVGVALLAQRMHKQHEEKLALLRDLGLVRVERDSWQCKVQSHMDGLKAALDTQFREWGLTGAEHEVGLLILKGLNHKEIAIVRGTTEATVRQQAQSIYRKADLPGKTAFSAYFLEDLLPPEAMMNSAPSGAATAFSDRV